MKTTSDILRFEKWRKEVEKLTELAIWVILLVGGVNTLFAGFVASIIVLWLIKGYRDKDIFKVFLSFTMTLGVFSLTMNLLEQLQFSVLWRALLFLGHFALFITSCAACLVFVLLTDPGVRKISRKKRRPGRTRENY